LRITWSVQDGSPSYDFAGFVLQADNVGVPVSRNAGLELFRWNASDRKSAFRCEADLRLDAIRSGQWNHFYCRAFVLDPTQDDTTLIVHPNTCRDSSEFLGRPRDASRPRWPRRTSRSTTCPYCFSEIAHRHIRFVADDPAGLPKRGRYTFWDWVLRRPPRPPRHVGEGVECLPVCPCCGRSVRDFPRSQPSLTIGFIGPNNSGQTTYCCALIQSLKTRVADDYSATVFGTPNENEQKLFNRKFPS